MKATLAILAALLLAGVLLFAQRERLTPVPEQDMWDYRFLQPAEIGPGEYKQVDWEQVISYGAQGWELVAVVPWILRNDEHRAKKDGEAKLVTQNYVSYYFKRKRPPLR